MTATDARTAPPAKPPADPSGTRRPRKPNKHNKAALLFLAPWLIGLLGLTVGPMIVSAYYSLTDFDFLNPPNFTGLENYERLLNDPRYLRALVNTIVYVLVSVPLRLAVALGVAMILKKAVRGVGIYRAAFYLPSLLGGSVAVAVLWRQVFDGGGLVNQVLALVGIEGADWINSPQYALGTLILLAAWQFGSPMLIFLAGLQQVPQDLYEAAEIDGAGAWRRFWKVTIPLITPVILFNLVMQMITAFQTFTPSFVVSNGTGGPLDSTLLYTLYLYQRAFQNFEMGYASAMAWVLLAIIAVMTLLVFRSSRKWVFYGDGR
ncbi:MULTISPECIES: carbohydrate ABC transporter permease [unclassified Brachybacterium]|uniref:carbohydrate ABC transporter permease n=1 Tax=unclassified Brachybacterium TaxID=2623841 RepID=UPI0040334824